MPNDVDPHVPMFPTPPDEVDALTWTVEEKRRGRGYRYRLVGVLARRSDAEYLAGAIRQMDGNASRVTDTETGEQWVWS